MSPAHLADQYRDGSNGVFGLPLAAGVARHSEEACVGEPKPEPDAPDLFEGEAADIEAEFRRRLSGLRGHSRQQRSGILRAAFEWKQTALQALRDKRAQSRRAQQAFRQGQRPAPN